MKISEKMTDALNGQISMEAYASNYYLSMASWCQVMGYQGASAFLYLQADEERQHMLKIVQFLDDLGIFAKIPEVKQPQSKFESLEDVFKTALSNEQTVTASINKMVDLAQQEKDHNTITILQWFVDEQIQEETKFETILQKFTLLGNDKLGINEIDKELGAIKPEPAAV